MCLAKLGARVLLTERAIALPLLRRNLAENSLGGGPASAEELSWGTVPLPAPVRGAANADTGFFDVVVGSDLMFPAILDCLPALVETLRASVGPATRCWIAHEPRAAGTDQALVDALEPHFVVRRERQDALPEGSPEDLWMRDASRSPLFARLPPRGSPPSSSLDQARDRPRLRRRRQRAAAVRLRVGTLGVLAAPEGLPAPRAAPRRRGRPRLEAPASPGRQRHPRRGARALLRHRRHRRRRRRHRADAARGRLAVCEPEPRGRRPRPRRGAPRGVRPGAPRA
ncbi:unnamed protein product, partial [Prorocentrum cordatum]